MTSVESDGVKSALAVEND